MKGSITFLFLLCSLFAQAQATYIIEEIKSGGFLLVETVAATEKEQAREFLQRFNTPEQLSGYVAELRKQSDEAKERAKKEMDSAAAIEGAANGIEQAGRAFFTPTLNAKKE